MSNQAEQGSVANGAGVTMAVEQTAVPQKITVDMGYLDQVEQRLLSEAAKWKAQHDTFTLNNKASLDLVRLAKQALLSSMAQKNPATGEGLEQGE